MDAEIDPGEDLEGARAARKARMNYALGCLRASVEEQLPVAERVAYLAMYREAKAEAEAGGQPQALCRISYSIEGCAEPDTSIGSREHMYVSDRRESEITADEQKAVEAVVEQLWTQAQNLPPTSRVRAWLLKIRSPLARYL